jgi:hypothetical protein
MTNLDFFIASILENGGMTMTLHDANKKRLIQ